MSVFKNRPTDEFYSFRFQLDGERKYGVCYGCTDYGAAVEYELNVKTSMKRLHAQKTLGELFENCRDMLIRKNPILLEKAFDMAMAKPRRRTPGEKREKGKRNYWDDFVFFIKRMHPDAMVMQKITKPIAEQYIALIRKHGSFKSYFLHDRREGLLAPNTLNEMHATCVQVFNLLKSETGMTENPFADIEKLIATSDSHEPYTFDELKMIFGKADAFLYPLFMIGLFSGLRLGDICNLKKSDIIFSRHFIVRSQRKTGREASIPMHEILERYLRELYDKSPDPVYLLPEHAEQYRRNSSAISVRVRHFLEGELGIKCMKEVPGRKREINVKGIHSLRHTFCTIAGVVGIPEAVVRSIVGHMTPEMTRLYTRHIEEADKLRYIQLFGARVGEIPSLPVERPALPDPIEERIKEITEKGNERIRLIHLARTLPIEEVRRTIAEILERVPMPPLPNGVRDLGV